MPETGLLSLEQWLAIKKIIRQSHGAKPKRQANVSELIDSLLVDRNNFHFAVSENPYCAEEFGFPA